MTLAFRLHSTPLRSTLGTAPGLVWLVLGLMLAAPGSARGQSELADLEPMTASPQALLAAADREPPEDAPIDVLLESSVLTFGTDGTSTHRSHRIYRVVDSDGAEVFDEVSTVFAPWHQETPTVRARVILPSGAVHALDRRTLTEGAIESDLPNTYQDLRRLVAPLPAIAPGVVVEQVIETVDRAPFFEAGTLHRVPFTAYSSPIRHARLVVDAPEGMELRIEARPEALAEPRVERADGRVRRIFEARDLEPATYWLPGQPPEAILYPFVAVSTARDWSALARYYSEVVDRQIAAMSAPEGRSLLGDSSLDEGSGSQWEQIAARLAWVHERVRYTGVQLGEAAIVPRPPAETLARRYGDCKDKATLMVALLREIGVPAYVALLRAGSTDDVIPDMPGLGAGGFDHAIVYVPGSPALWIDATDPYAPLGELPTMSQGRLALVASPGTQGLVRTPVSDAAENRTAETREVFLAEYGPGRMVNRNVYRGAHARDLRARWDGSTTEELAEHVGSVTADLFGSDRVAELEHSPFTDPGPFELSYAVEDAAWSVTDLTQGIVVVPTGDLLANLPFLGFDDEEKEERTVDFFVAEPHEVEVLYRIHVPHGFAVRALPESETRTLGPATLATELKEGDGEVRVRLSFRLAERRMSPDELRALREGVREIQEGEPIRLWFDNVGWSHLTAGRIAEAVSEYRRLAEAHPDEALHLLHLSVVLQEVGMRHEARRLAARAVELEPESHLAHALFGQVLLHDGLGRFLAPGFEREAAIEALRRARELDPEDTDTAVNLALALEHEADGSRYGDPEGLRQAIEVYREVVDDLATTEYGNNLALALLWADRPKEALEVLDGDADDPERYATAVAAEAMANGTEAAIARAERRVSGGRSERSQILTLAAQSLFQLRHYPEATGLLRAATRASSNGGDLAEVIELYERMRRHEEVKTDPENPAHAVRDMMNRMLRGGADTEYLRQIGVTEWYRNASEEQLQGELEEADFREIVAAQATSELSDDLFHDILLSGIEWTSEEVPRLGHLVTMKAPFGVGDSATFSVMVVESDGGFRIAGSDQDAADYGRYAYELARAGDLERARAFLDRALDVSEAADEDETLLSPEELLHELWPAEDPSDAEAIALAGAVLASEEYPDAALVETLRSAEPAPAHTAARDQALARALLTLGENEEALEVARRIEEATGQGFYVQRATLAIDPDAEIEPIPGIDEELDPEVLAWTQQARKAAELTDAGHLDEALAILEGLLDDSDTGSDALIFNQAAWIALALGDVSDRTLDWARSAVESDRARSYASLHTLASIQAARGSALDAYDTLMKAVALEPGRRAGDPEWYVLGLVAEGLGLNDAARRYYERVEAPEEDEDPLSTRVMAKDRLRRLADERL